MMKICVFSQTFSFIAVKSRQIRKKKNETEKANTPESFLCLCVIYFTSAGERDTRMCSVSPTSSVGVKITPTGFSIYFHLSAY